MLFPTCSRGRNVCASNYDMYIYITSSVMILVKLQTKLRITFLWCTVNCEYYNTSLEMYDSRSYTWVLYTRACHSLENIIIIIKNDLKLNLFNVVHVAFSVANNTNLNNLILKNSPFLSSLNVSFKFVVCL